MKEIKEAINKLYDKQIERANEENHKKHDAWMTLPVDYHLRKLRAKIESIELEMGNKEMHTVLLEDIADCANYLAFLLYHLTSKEKDLEDDEILKTRVWSKCIRKEVKKK